MTRVAFRTNKFPARPNRSSDGEPSSASRFPIDTCGLSCVIAANFSTIGESPHNSKSPVIQISRRGLVFLGTLLLLPWVVVVFLVISPRWTAPQPIPAAPVFAYDEYIQKARPGPWGELQYSRILIEPPDEFVIADAEQKEPVRWFFPGYTLETLAALWQTAGLSAEQMAQLHPREIAPGVLAVEPSADPVLGLSRESRTAIYSVLSAFTENPAQNEPFRFRADSAEEWFENSSLSPETLSLVKGLLYRRGTSLLFSDYAVVLPRIQSRTERQELIKTLARKATLLVKLRISPSSDLETISGYWGRGPRRKAIHSLLESLAQRPGGMTLDIAHVLPKFARAHIFTYPAFDDTVGGARDCHWTALNFFNDVPDDRFVDVQVVKQTIETDYVPAVDRPMFGDILVFSRPDGTVIHSCVFVADDIVFTKNGGSPVMPWILMNLSDVIAFYPSDPELTISVYRRKDL